MASFRGVRVSSIGPDTDYCDWALVVLLGLSAKMPW